MDIKISELLKNKFINNEEFIQKSEIHKKISEFIDIDISQIIFIKGKISFKNISPTTKVHVKKNKQQIIFDLKAKDIFVRDII
jgi:hypothetical protein